MVLGQLCGRVKLLLLGIVGVIRRGFCCLSRRRKSSTSDCEALQCVSVIREHPTGKRNEVEKDWNSWDDSPRTVEEHIEQYRQKLARPPTPKDLEPEPDFFQDMTPKIKPQQKLLIKTEQEFKTDFSRLKATTDIPITIAADLEDWTEEDPGGWEEQDSETTKKLIREKRKELRAQKQTRPKDNSKISPSNFAERIGSRHS